MEDHHRMTYFNIWYPEINKKKKPSDTENIALMI